MVTITKKIHIVGAGLTGASACARLLQLGIDSKRIVLYEKKDEVGGLCQDKFDGKKFYCPYGPHNFHTNNLKVWDFVNNYSKFSGYRHKKGIVINGILHSYPLKLEEFVHFEYYPEILKEIETLPEIKRTDNFRNWCIDVFGQTFYKLIIENYTQKLWCRNPEELPAEWAPKRLKWGSGDNYLFGNEHQGIPIGGYTNMIKKMMGEVEVKFNNNIRYNSLRHFCKKDDIIITTCSLDNFFQERNGVLEYIGVKWDIIKDSNFLWPDYRYGTINYPQADDYIRKCNFGVIYQNHDDDYEYIGIEYPNKDRMYPVNSKENNEKWLEYKKLADAQNEFTIIPAGRLGTFQYLNMDEAIASGIDSAETAYAKFFI